MRVCPHCGDYYDDDGPLFCSDDGSALVNVDREGDRWRDGERVLEEKARVINRQIRKKLQRRWWSIAITSVLVVMVVYVVASNTVLYFKSPDPVAKDGSPPSPPADSAIKHAATPAVSPTPTPPCDESDQETERQVITSRYSEEFTARIKTDSTEIINGKVPPGTSWVEPRLVEPRTEVALSKTCTTATVTVTYKWRVLANINGVQNPLFVDGSHRFQCSKTSSVWLCN